MTKLSLSSRILLAYTITFGLLLTCFALVIYRSSAEAELATLDGKLQRYAADVRGRIEEDPDEAAGQEQREAPEVKEVRADDLPGARCRLTDPRGQSLASDTVFQRLAAENPSFTNTTGHFTANLSGTTYRVFRSVVEIDERRGYLLEVAAPMSEAEARLSRLRLMLFGAVPASLFLAAVAAWLITRSALRPIAAMTRTARSLSVTDLDERVPLPASHDEVRTLAETLNGMLDRIARAFRSQSQFVTDASHELRTPLTVITTELEFAERQGEGPAKESVRIALTETERLSHIADGLLLLARLDAASLPLSREPLRLDQLLAECVQRMRGPAKKKDIRIEQAASEPVEITGDPTRLKSVILNLLDNAITYSDTGTAVTASLRTGESIGDSVALCIRDEGYGIAEEDLPHIFQRFYRPAVSRGNDRGCGLGLAIVDRIVRLHGGSIAVSSTLGKGSVFTVRLPLCASS